MARSYAAIHLRIWADPDWRALDVDAQHLYLLLLSQPTLNLAGVLPMQTRRWASCVADWDAPAVDMALTRLADARFVVVDQDTEEVLIRSFIRNDGNYKIPNVLKSMLQVAEGTQAPALRAELAVELGRLEPLSGKKADESLGWIAATRLVLAPLSGPSGPCGEPLPEPLGEGLPEGLAQPLGEGFVVTHSPTVTGTVVSSANQPMPQPSGSGSGSGTSLSLVRNLGEGSSPALPDEPPNCAKHADWDDADIPPCGGCGRAREKWQKARDEAARLARIEAAKPKPMCPEHPGQVDGFCGPCRSEKLAANQ